METRHIRLDHENALEAKKQILSTELNIIQTLRKLKAYKVLRKKELLKKSKLKTNLNVLRTKINLMQSFFPAEAKELNVPKKLTKKEKKERIDINKELEEIRNKLAKLK